MARINMHHIVYRPKEWKVELTGQMHRVMTVIQNTKPSTMQYARITNFIHSLMHEWNRMRMALDTTDEKRKPIKRRKKKKRIIKRRITKIEEE